MVARLWRDSRELVELAVERIGDGSPTRLADRMRLGGQGYQKVNRWRKGSEPGYADTITMLRLLGLLRETPELVATPDLAEADSRLEELAAGVALILQGQDAMPAEIYERLDALEKRLSELVRGLAPPEEGRNPSPRPRRRRS